MKVTKDLRLARIYFAAAGGKDGAADAAQGFRSAAGFIKRHLGPQLGLRYMPELEFFYDESFDHGSPDRSIAEIDRRHAWMNPILQTIKTADRILVTTHTDPDGDAVGSLLAMGLALERLGKQTIAVQRKPDSGGLPVPAGRGPHRTASGCRSRRYDARRSRLRRSLAHWQRGATASSRMAAVINIDHHVSNTGFGSHRLIDGQACATAEIVYRLIRALEVPLDKAIATCIYTGILTDTGSFRFSNTNAAAFAISRDMMDAGVDPYEVAQRVFGSYSLGRIKLLNLALNSIEISPNGKLSLMTVTRAMLEETRTQQEDVDGLINYARRIEDVRVAALIQEQTNGLTTADGRARLACQSALGRQRGCRGPGRHLRRRRASQRRRLSDRIDPGEHQVGAAGMDRADVASKGHRATG